LIFVEEVRQDGGINKHEEHMIRQVIEFDEMTAAEVFIPRVDITAVSFDSTAQEIDNVFAESGFSRLPVYKDSVDNIVGIILLKDFHHYVQNGKKNLSEIIKSVVFVTKTMKIAKLLKHCRKNKAIWRLW